ncbi:MAG: hypothetical protein H5U02_00490 [Clostridia bacterium]|nr:hypothetical protein [Clostridia bacterium]
MRIWGIKPEKRQFEWGEMDIVALGERGRGRKEVLIPFHCEFDPEARDYELGKTRSGGVKIIRNGGESDGHIAVLSSAGAYIRGAHGDVGVLAEDAPKVDVLSCGWGAFGDAGRVGIWYEYLVVIRQYPARFVVWPTRGPMHYVVFPKTNPVRVRTGEVDAFMELTGIDLGDRAVELGKLLLE